MKKYSQFALLAAAAFVSACAGGSKNSDAAKNNSPSIEQLTIDGPVANNKHLFLRIVSDTPTDSSHIYVAKSLFKQDTVGFQVEVLNTIGAGIIDDQSSEDVGFTKGKMKFSTIGSQSDAFIKALGAIYEIPTQDPFSSTTLLPNVFSSNKVNVDLSKTATYSFKLFFDNQTGVAAETFMNLDTYKKSIEFSEKSPTFRALFIAALAGK